MTSQLLSPLAGVVVAGIFAYAVHEAMTDQTRAMLSSLQARSAVLQRVDAYDPETSQPRTFVPSSYVPQRPTYWEEIHARWSVRILCADESQAAGVLQRVLDTDFLGTTPRNSTGSRSSSSDGSVADAFQALAPRAADAAPAFGILHRRYGDENTRYAGQGVSLR
ncbi:hypothetical protein MCUN1_003043 [Malassezia cuniculi]|uniref:Altered inheritance of mitochondria protein 5, mitochondrial n=1 Tax=Malassezia cuniculi TaxID=948313 RepID=A0AAF0EWS5_9BASI|nr:hypothetical protein MCUN1_003043 [Malassezia cuniculi]